MNLTLFVDDKEKNYTVSFIKARMFRKAISFGKTMDFDNLGVDQIDELVGFVCDLFNNQFTVDEFYDGLPVDEFMSTIIEAMHSVTGAASGNKASGDEGNEKK